MEAVLLELLADEILSNWCAIHDGTYGLVEDTHLDNTRLLTGGLDPWGQADVYFERRRNRLLRYAPFDVGFEDLYRELYEALSALLGETQVSRISHIRKLPTERYMVTLAKGGET